LGTTTAGLPTGAITTLNFPIFNMLLGVNPGWLGTVGAIANCWDAVIHPLIGHASDRTRSRWGRRRPYLLAGTLLIAVLAAAFFQFGAGWSPQSYLTWYLVLSLLFFTATATYSVPYYALGIEIATDYDQRTRVVAYRSVMDKTSGIANQWMFRFVELFSNSLVGAKVLGGILAIAALGSGLCTFFGTKERFGSGAVQKSVAVRESLFTAMGNVLANSVYRRLLLVWVIMTLNIGLFNALGLYLNVYYIYGGDKAAGATLGGAVGTLGLVLSMAAIPFTATLCRKFGKHQVLKMALWLYMVGSFLKWVCINPRYPWLQLVLPFFFSIGISSVFVVMSSMQADIVDLDEYQHGGRREGMFGAVGAWVMKLGGALALALSGWIVVVTGFDVTHAAAQPEGVFFKMRILFSLAPILGSVLALICLKNYPLTRERSEEIRAELEIRRVATR
jgi:GPH family glycoside/pentoside/hexuronide:cation symporter